MSCCGRSNCPDTPRNKAKKPNGSFRNGSIRNGNGNQAYAIVNRNGGGSKTNGRNGGKNAYSTNGGNGKNYILCPPTNYQIGEGNGRNGQKNAYSTNGGNGQNFIPCPANDYPTDEENGRNGGINAYSTNGGNEQNFIPSPVDNYSAAEGNAQNYIQCPADDYPTNEGNETNYIPCPADGLNQTYIVNEDGYANLNEYEQDGQFNNNFNAIAMGGGNDRVQIICPSITEHEAEDLDMANGEQAYRQSIEALTRQSPSRIRFCTDQMPEPPPMRVCTDQIPEEPPMTVCTDQVQEPTIPETIPEEQSTNPPKNFCSDDPSRFAQQMDPVPPDPPMKFCSDNPSRFAQQQMDYNDNCPCPQDTIMSAILDEPAYVPCPSLQQSNWNPDSWGPYNQGPVMEGPPPPTKSRPPPPPQPAAAWNQDGGEGFATPNCAPCDRNFWKNLENFIIMAQEVMEFARQKINQQMEECGVQTQAKAGDAEPCSCRPCLEEQQMQAVAAPTSTSRKNPSQMRIPSRLQTIQNSSKSALPSSSRSVIQRSSANIVTSTPCVPSCVRFSRKR